jgi:hypothetical protein
MPGSVFEFRPILTGFFVSSNLRASRAMMKVDEGPFHPMDDGPCRTPRLCSELQRDLKVPMIFHSRRVESSLPIWSFEHCAEFGWNCTARLVLFKRKHTGVIRYYSRMLLLRSSSEVLWLALSSSECRSVPCSNVSILPSVHLSEVPYPHSLSALIFRCQCCSKWNTRSRLAPRLLPRNNHPALTGELFTPSSHKNL